MIFRKFPVLRIDEIFVFNCKVRAIEIHIAILRCVYLMRQVVIEQTRFPSTVFLCSEFKLENIYSGVNVCRNFNRRGGGGGKLFLQITGKIAKIRTLKYFLCHAVAGLVPSSPIFNASVVLVNSQLVCLQPVGILNFVNMFKCLFLSLSVGHNKTTVSPVIIFYKVMRNNAYL